MIQGRIPEVIIKFNEKPELPTEGKKVLLEIAAENNLTIKAEVNRKTLKKHVARMDSFDEWIAVLSGKIKSFSAEGVIELEGGGVQVYEKQKKEADSEKTTTT